MHPPVLLGARRALGAGPGLRGVAGTCKIPPRLPSFRGAGKVRGGRQGRGNPGVTLGLELAKECFPGSALGSAGRARALLGVRGTCLINFNGPHVPGMVSSK